MDKDSHTYSCPCYQGHGHMTDVKGKELRCNRVCCAKLTCLLSGFILTFAPNTSTKNGFLLQENKDDSFALLLNFTLPVDFILSHTYEKWDTYTRNNGNFKHCNTGANCNLPPYLVLHLRIQSTVVRSIFKCANTEHVQIFLIIIPQNSVLYLYSIYILLVIKGN